MTTTTSSTPSDMIDGFDKFKASIDRAYDMARLQLESGDLVGCQLTLALIGRQHAKTSVSLRNLCIKRGLMEDTR